MKIDTFESKIQEEINKDLHIEPHPSNTDVAGVYFDSAYLCAVPSEEILPNKNRFYLDKMGNQHRSIPEAKKKIRQELAKMEKDSERYSKQRRDI